MTSEMEDSDTESIVSETCEYEYAVREQETRERINNCIYRKINNEKIQERVSIVCPLCRAGLEPLQLEKDEQGYQTIWWICKNTIEAKCSFPGAVPPDVFWVKRSPEEINYGIIPKPDLKKLPEKLRYLYPSIFTTSGRNTPDSLRPNTPVSNHSQVPQVSTRNVSEINSNSSLCDFDAGTSTTYSNSVIEVDPITSNKVPVALGSNSLESNSSTSSYSCATFAAGVVPTQTSARKRQAGDEPVYSASNQHFHDFLFKYLGEAKKRGASNEELTRLANFAKMCDSSLSGNEIKRYRNEYMTQDEMYDAIFQNVPEITKEQAAAAVRDKSLSAKVNIICQGRTTRDGNSFLKLLGLAGAPVPKDNRWRSETREKVDNVLRRAAKETHKVLKTNQKPTAASTSRTPRSLGKPSTLSEIDRERQKQLELEAERKTRALVQSKINARREEMQRKMEEARLQQILALQQEQIEQPPSTTTDIPTRMRHDSLGLEIPTFASEYSFPPHEPGYGDLFDDIDLFP